jgi:hypothetical protein
VSSLLRSGSHLGPGTASASPREASRSKTARAATHRPGKPAPRRRRD